MKLAMKLATTLRIATLAVMAANTFANAAGSSDSPLPPSSEEQGSIQAQVWFERALALDTGVAGPPDAARAFDAMLRAAEAGYPPAAFNVAVMLDSGRGAPRNVAEASVWYARAAAAGNRRAAFNLGQLYQSGEGVPANVDLSRAWYAVANLPAARERMAQWKTAPNRPTLIQAPQPLFPTRKAALDPSLQDVDLVWTAALEPEAVRFFVELRALDAHASHEVWSGFVDVSSVRLPLPPGGRTLAWRVSAVARSAGSYAVSDWSVFAIPPS